MGGPGGVSRSRDTGREEDSPMKTLKQILPSTLLLLGAAAAPCLAAPAISGDYLEARTSDVYTGPCFANAEVNLAGKEAVLAWNVRQGAWKGVPVEGLSV